MSPESWTARFEQTFTGPASAARARIWQQVYGLEYPAWADPFSYVSVTELRRFARTLQTVRGRYLVDVGCGRGGPGLWVAAVTGARLIGIDTDEAALAAARHRAGQVGMAGRPAQVADHRPLLDQAGFEILSYEETEAWRERHERTGRALLAAAAELAGESGGKAAQRAASIAEMNAALACVIRRVLVIARRRSPGT